jgi:hypothetical protein
LFRAGLLGLLVTTWTYSVLIAYHVAVLAHGFM